MLDPFVEFGALVAHGDTPHPSCKYDNQRDPDQGAHASNYSAEIKISRDVLRLELEMLAEHGIFPRDYPATSITRQAGNRSDCYVQKCT